MRVRLSVNVQVEDPDLGDISIRICTVWDQMSSMEARGHALKSLAWKLGLQPSSFGALLQWLCWVEQWKTRGWLERTAGQHFLTGLCISVGISNVFQGSQLWICLFLTHPLTMLSILPEEFTNVLGFKLLIHTADFLGLSFPISQWRVWPDEMKGIPLLWYLLIFKGAETHFGILHGTHLVWILLGSVTRPALPSLQLYLLLSTQEGTLTNLCLQVLRLIFLQVLWASFCSRDDFAAQRYWHSDVGRMLSRQFEDQSVTLSGGVEREEFLLGPLANGCLPVGSALLVILLF